MRSKRSAARIAALRSSQRQGQEQRDETSTPLNDAEDRRRESAAFTRRFGGSVDPAPPRVPGTGRHSYTTDLHGNVVRVEDR